MRRLLRTEWVGLAFFTFLAIVILMAAASLRYKAPPGQDPPKLTDWMQAWGTVGGVFAALLAALAAALLLRHEWRKARLDQEAQREAQRVRHAHHVTWYLKESASDAARAPADAGDLTGPSLPNVFVAAVLVIINSGDNCVYQALASIPAFRGVDEEYRYLARRGIGTVPPGQTEILMPMLVHPGGSYSATRYASELPTNRPVEYVQFRDPSGSWWRRYGDGDLVEVPTTGPDTAFPDYSF